MVSNTNKKVFYSCNSYTVKISFMKVKKFYEKKGERLLYCENKVVLDFNVILFMTYYEELKGDTIIFWILGISKQVIRSFLTFLIHKIYVFANIYKIFSKKLKNYFKWFLDNHLRGDFFFLKKTTFFCPIIQSQKYYQDTPFNLH